MHNVKGVGIRVLGLEFRVEGVGFRKLTPPAA